MSLRSDFLMKGTWRNFSKLSMSSGRRFTDLILSWKNGDASYISRTLAFSRLSCIFSSSSRGIVSISLFQNAILNTTLIRAIK